jgi:dephospho-CoA kinase
MTVIGTVGLPGSGKGEFAKVARAAGIPVVTMGDVIREECRDRGLDPAVHHGDVATALREEGGPGAIAARALPLVEAASAESDVVLVDGLRSPAEADRFEEAFGDEFVLVSVEAPFEVRRERIAERGRDAGDDEDGETLRERDERERGFGVGDVIERADVSVENVGTLGEYRRRVREILTDAGADLDPIAEVEEEAP